MRQVFSVHAYDVIVIGAGLSGLSAARAVHQAGKSILVLEARDRVGGKTCSVSTSTGGRVDLGAAWVNEHLMPRITGLARESGNDLITQYTAGDSGLLSAQGSPWHPEDLANFIKINKLFIALCADLPTSHADAAQHERIRRYDGITVSAWLDMPDVQARPRIKDLLRPGVHALLGVEMEELSMAYLIHYAATAGGWTALISNEADGAQYQRTRDGTQGISLFLADHLPKRSVRLDSPVESIHQGGEDTVEIVTRSGESFFGKQVILTIPSPLYDTIHFTPPLPPSTQGVLAQRAFLGVLGKCIAIYDTPWWRGEGWKGTWQSSEGPISMIFDTCDGYLDGEGESSGPECGKRSAVGADEQGQGKGKTKGPIARQYSLTCFIASHHAVDYFALSAEKRADAVVDQLARLFHFSSESTSSPSSLTSSGEGPRPPLPIQLFDHLWTEEEFSRGAPCPVLPTGVLSGYGKYYGRRHGRAWFAGTEYSDVWKGYMEGAVHSGQTAAEDVLAVL